MVLTRDQSRTALIHLFHTVLEQPMDGSIFGSFYYEGIEDIVGFVNLTTTDLEKFEYSVLIKQDDSPKEVTVVAALPKRDQRLLKNAWKWSQWLYSQHAGREWLSLTYADFSTFSQVTLPQLTQGLSPNAAKDSVHTFQANIKLGFKSYPLHDGHIRPSS
jgi:hypothetical protein